MTPDDPNWARTVTASKASAILGLSPWASPWLMWCRMKGLADPDTDNVVAKQRGHDLENAVLDWWLRENGAFDRGRQRTFWHEDWACATPDMVAFDDKDVILVEAKTDRGSYGWDVLPAHYQAQGLFQLGCEPYAARVEFPVLHAGLDFRTYVVERDQELVDAVMAKCRDFYDSLDADEPPDLSGDACEYDVIRKMHPDIDKQAGADIPADLAWEYVATNAATKRIKGLKAQVLEAMGRAQYATFNGVRIARRQPASTGVTLYCTTTPADIEGLI